MSDKDPADVLYEPKKRGRPAIDPDDPSVPFQLSLPSKELAAVKEQAERDRVTPQEFIRRLLREHKSS